MRALSISPVIYVLCGIPASGKSTLAKYLSKEKNAILYSYDDLEGANTTPEISNAVMKQMFENIKYDLSNGKNVICDVLMITKKQRLRLLDYLNDVCCEKICIVLQTSLEECLVRNTNRNRTVPDFVLIHSHNIFEYPSYNEGWNELFVY